MTQKQTAKLNAIQQHQYYQEGFFEQQRRAQVERARDKGKAWRLEFDYALNCLLLWYSGKTFDLSKRSLPDLARSGDIPWSVAKEAAMSPYWRAKHEQEEYRSKANQSNHSMLPWQDLKEQAQEAVSVSTPEKSDWSSKYKKSIFDRDVKPYGGNS